jgi:hypothetical protein
MGTGAKIAIGCGILVVVTGLAVVGGVIGLGMWGKSKIDSFAAEQQKIQDLEKQANENAFEQPTDGIIPEARLVKFLEVRKAVYPTYQKYQTQLEGMKTADQKKEPDFGDVQNALGALGGLNELRTAHVQALVAAGMSQDEYRYLVENIYKSAWASEFQKTSGGKTMTEATEDAMKQAARALEQQAEQTPDPSLPADVQKQMREAQEQMRKQQKELEKQTEEAKDKAEQFEVPPANVELFRKYEADIKKYAMTGLEWLGL